VSFTSLNIPSNIIQACPAPAAQAAPTADVQRISISSGIRRNWISKTTTAQGQSSSKQMKEDTSASASRRVRSSIVDGAENPHRFDGRGRYVVRRFSGHGSGRQRSGARRRCRRAPPGAPRAPRPAIPRRLHLCRADCVSPDVVAQPRRRAAAFPGGGGSGFFCRYDSPSMSTTWQCWAKRSTVAWMDVAPSKTSPHFL